MSGILSCASRTSRLCVLCVCLSFVPAAYGADAGTATSSATNASKTAASNNAESSEHTPALTSGTSSDDDSRWTLTDDDDPFADWNDDEHTLDTVYFKETPKSFERFDLEKTQSVEHIGTKTIREHGARTVEEAIKTMTPWAPVPSTSASPGPLIVDGLNGSWVKVLIDGVPYTRTQTSRQGAYPDLGNIPIDPSQIERIDIYRGSGPAGTCGASGTIINMITKDPTQRYSGNISLHGGLSTQGISQYGGRGNLTIPIGEEWALRASGGWSRHLALDVDNDGIDDRPKRTVDDLTLEALWQPKGDDRLSIGLRTFGTKQWVQPENPETDLGDRTDQRAFGGHIRYKNAASNDNHITARFSFERVDHRYYQHVPWSGFDRTKADTVSLQLQTDFNWERSFGKHDVALEICHSLDAVERSGEAGKTPNIREQQICFRAQDKWRVSDVLTLTANALGGYHATMGPRWGGSLGAVFRLNDQQGFRLSFDTGQRVPTVEERFIDFDHADIGYLLVGNEDLTPEESFSGRAGWVAKNPNGHFGGEISAYVTLLRNRIDPVVKSTSPFTYSYANFGRGLSAGIDGVLRAHDIGGWFGFDLTYNFLPIARDPDTGDDLSLRSHHHLRLNLKGSWFDDKLVVWTSAGIRSRMLWGGPVPGDVLDSAAKPPNQPIFRWDAGISGNPHKDIWLGLTARNITNYANKNWGPMPGFEFLFTVEASLQSKPRVPTINTQGSAASAPTMPFGP